ncbi:MAG: hypothetical protein KME09_22450 [Pleurocapsa minor HA4230-MV1]|jgi:hypothetical protein|nr:hypothetical protein [Pleurocapsa minor HA4230-MV1]
MSEHEKQKLSLEWLKKYLVVLFAPGVFLSVIGYVAKQKFDSLHQREQQEYQAHKDTYTSLYEEGQSKIIALRNSRDKLFSLLENNYGISSFDMKSYLSEFEQAFMRNKSLRNKSFRTASYTIALMHDLRIALKFNLV